MRRGRNLKAVDQLAKAVAILGQINCIGRRPQNRHPRRVQTIRQVQRGLAAELDDDTLEIA